MSKVAWLSPSPLWDDVMPLGTARFRAPTLLRFATDTFMEEFQAQLATQPHELVQRVARYETWRKPEAGLLPLSTKQLKLFQPVHGRFYLVTATLACRTPGLPEHTVDLAQEESVSFVLRRIASNGELAWVTAADGRQGWMSAQPRALAHGEEALPMFPSNFAADDLTRRVFAGLVPVGRREAYVGGRSIPLPPATGTVAATTMTATTIAVDDPRVIEFQRAVLEPWVSLREWYDRDVLEGDNTRKDRANVASEHASALILLDFATYLQEELEPVWNAINNSALAPSLPTPLGTLYDELNVRLWTRNAGTSVNLRQALIAAEEHRDAIEAMTLPVGVDEDTPAASVPTVPPTLTAVLLVRNARQPGTHADDNDIVALLDREGPDVEADDILVRRLKKLVMRALEALPPDVRSRSVALSAGTRPPLMQPMGDGRGDDLFVIRCVYQRPRCGKGFAPLISDPSEPFQLASFFDPDAPQRPVRVALPIDTSPAGLRKFDKNVGFVLSNELRKQMSRVKGMKQLVENDIGGPSGLDISVICSLSIPIITICALILLMIIVSILNIIFWWIPFLMLCFPVPSLKAKLPNAP